MSADNKPIDSTRQAIVPDHGDPYYLRNPVRSLLVLFLAWKAILFPIIANCPGLGYDTSTNLLASAVAPSLPTWFSVQASSSGIWNFVRWDAIYFVRVAERGYLYEQEWAWGYGYTRLLSFLSSGISFNSMMPFNLTNFTSSKIAFATPNGVSIAAIAISGIALSHLTHFCSVLVLHTLTELLFGYETRSQKLFCLVSAALHVISPAGAFLSAPYTESPFSFLNFTGFYLYSSALLAEKAGNRGRRDILVLLAGILFAAATTIRGNGIISGCLFAYDAVQGVLQFLHHGLSIDLIRRSGIVVLGGIIVALGSIIPQYIAYTEYCGATSRPWCARFLPSIYGWVQVHYWYWTVSNLPLFILAAPVLVAMLYSSFVALSGRLGPSHTDHTPISKMNTSQSAVLRLAIAQGILALMTLTSFHIQIINRIASGYPVWYWYLATSACGSSKPLNNRLFRAAVQGMTMYALIQAVLFGSFLPPA
ncbi:DUF409 domain protein [Talaromyces stipitatus ATCC 10500]|uniref:GPI mannosyltransferase 2 n=1 Tax=Talaromyces stipitatus (strain ATCC 10500 / CBS 375.48 / QM 6759 / NRRL 1006) TaxID=441959 RepID=B8LW25_TALSN|nr:DUF409 domain protein [Talaromyces stipitatus ATCC 10500]EED24390.1 DUF409 domain protein [Talaromyces stipitatus ATCC 10500]